MSRDRRVLSFVTTNIKKFEEVKLLLREHGLTVKMLRMKAIEPQLDDIVEIAKFVAKHVVESYEHHVVVEDAGLFIKALNGFPGPYSSFVWRTIGNRGILKLMSGLEDREAEFRSAVAYYSPEMRRPKCFYGIVRGTITLEEKGTLGFGYDPIFASYEGNGRTFAEMQIAEKNKLSHRARAFANFAKWYKRRYGLR